MTVDKEQAAADYEALRLKDAEKLAQRKKKFDENRFAHIEKQNKLHGPPSQQPPPQQLETPLPPVTFEESNGGDKNTNKNNEKKGWRIFKKKNTPASTTELIKEGGAPSTTESTQARAHGPEVAVTVDLRDADFKPKNVPVRIIAFGFSLSLLHVYNFSSSHPYSIFIYWSSFSTKPRYRSHQIGP